MRIVRNHIIAQALLLLYLTRAVPADEFTSPNHANCKDEVTSCNWSGGVNDDRKPVEQRCPLEGAVTASTPPPTSVAESSDGSDRSATSSEKFGQKHAALNLYDEDETTSVLPTTAGPSGEGREPVTATTDTNTEPPGAEALLAAAEEVGIVVAGGDAGDSAAAASATAAAATAIAVGTDSITVALEPALARDSSVPDSSPSSSNPAAARGVPAAPARPSDTEGTPVAEGSTATAAAAAADSASDASNSASAAAAAESPLGEVRSLLHEARLAVARLEAEVTRQERRLTGLQIAASAAPGLVAAGSSGAVDPAVAAATAAALRSLGVDGSSASAAARQALRDALQLVLRERRAAAAAAAGAEAGSGAAGSGLAAYASSSGAEVAEEDWFGRHFALRSAVRLTPPPPPAAADTTAAYSEEPSAAAAAAAATVPVTITCVFLYELPYPDAAAAGGGALQYIVAGDAAGALHLLRPSDGTVMAALPTGTDSPVTACSAYSVRRYESTIVTGHANGQTRSFTVVLKDAEEEATATAAAAAEGDVAGAAGGQEQQSRRRQRQRDGRTTSSSRVVVQSVQRHHVVESMPPGALPWAAVEELLMATEGRAQAAAEAEAAAGGVAAAAATESHYTGPPAPIMHILPYRLGHKATGRRHVLVLDRAGNLRLQRDNGTLRFWTRTNRTQLAVRFVGTYVVMLSAYHATLMNTLQPRPPRAYACHHLNGSRLIAAAFDGHRPFRGYGINGRGELLAMVTPHEGGLSTCKVHRATPLPWLNPEQLTDPASRVGLSLTPLRGYLLLTHGSNRVLFNVTGVVRTGIPTLTSTDDALLADAASAVVVRTPDAAPATSTPSSPDAALTPGATGALLPSPPVVAVGPGSQVVVLALVPSPPPLPPPSPPPTGAAADANSSTDGASAGPGGWTASGGAAGGALLVVLDARMPRPPLASGVGKIWTQPVFIAAIMLVGLYQFWRMSNTRSQRRAMPSTSRGARSRRGYGAGYGGSPYGDAGDFMHGDDRPRGALRRGRYDRPMGRVVSFEDDYY